MALDELMTYILHLMSLYIQEYGTIFIFPTFVHWGQPYTRAQRKHYVFQQRFPITDEIDPVVVTDIAR